MSDCQPPPCIREEVPQIYGLQKICVQWVRGGAQVQELLESLGNLNAPPVGSPSGLPGPGCTLELPEGLESSSARAICKPMKSESSWRKPKSQYCLKPPGNASMQPERRITQLGDGRGCFLQENPAE